MTRWAWRAPVLHEQSCSALYSTRAARPGHTELLGLGLSEQAKLTPATQHNGGTGQMSASPHMEICQHKTFAELQWKSFWRSLLRTLVQLKEFLLQLCWWAVAAVGTKLPEWPSWCRQEAQGEPCSYSLQREKWHLSQLGESWWDKQSRAVSSELRSALKPYLDAFLSRKKRSDNIKLRIYFYVSSSTSTRDRHRNELDTFFSYDQAPLVSGQTAGRTRPRF